ncbi:alkaline phosphatase D family protein [Corynebacterium wankanglinii]|uniref:Twin-arginine translocation signal domain-containing protein n=1 Tax=Corynebacterium wankanglinii TaxID=2735136 RepID=A0A838CG48_9CORY|nr:alkaline phosphatase D family protein [Corynebacterium wankanglinii]MBA1834191.1 twin-arginine translocation signal domain-containing protein [Corynebacterium wankanglinii]
MCSYERVREPKAVDRQTRVSRRRFLRTAAVATSAAGAAAMVPSAQSQSPLPAKPVPAEVELQPLPFVHGVASGDPLPDAVVIWTRITPDEAAFPGSGGGASTRVRWRVARDEELRDAVAEGEAESHPESDHTIHVDVRGLDADTVYYYAFTVVDGPHAGAVSPLGRTTTAPAGHVDRQRWAIASCANWEAGFFSAYADMAQRAWAGQLDLTVFLGDYIYEFAQYEYAGYGPVRLHHPAHETVSLADYRIRYGRYRTDLDLQDAHAALPWVVVWDDHEVANNYWRDGAENHDPYEGDFGTRRDAAMRAYFEWMPVRLSETSEQGRIYRSLEFGDLVELTIMDLRTYRDVEFWKGGARQPGDARSMLGSEQYDWLTDTLERSTAAWNALGNSVMFSPLHVGATFNNPATRPVVESLSANILSTKVPVPELNELPLNGDQWDGYDFERRRLINTLGRLGKHPIFLTGDIHSEWAHTITHAGAEIGCEIVCSSITAPNVAEATKIPAGHRIFDVASSYLRAANPSLHHVALDTHGYTIVDITAEAVGVEYLRVGDILAAHSPVRSGATLTWRRGAGFGQ